MSVADDIRQFCIEQYVEPARKRGDYVVAIRSGDVHDRMDLSQRMPAVCGALGADKFELLVPVRRITIDGPLKGANAIFVFRLR